MTNICTTTRRSEQGFTLVELAIVMVIIGLLIGGVLKGQELIGNARITATVAQLRSIEAAMNGFQDKYNALPGDIQTPNTRLPNCAAAPCNLAAGAGRGDGVIGAITGALPNPVVGGTEQAVAFVHLSAADFISGIDPVGASLTYGRMLPSIRTGTGGFFISYDGANGIVTQTTMPRKRHYMVVSGDLSLPAANNGPLSGVQAFQVDTKLDDGGPQSGTIQANLNGTCDASATAYDTTGLGSCGLYIRVLN